MGLRRVGDTSKDSQEQRARKVQNTAKESSGTMSVTQRRDLAPAEPELGYFVYISNTIPAMEN